MSVTVKYRRQDMLRSVLQVSVFLLVPSKLSSQQQYYGYSPRQYGQRGAGGG